MSNKFKCVLKFKYKFVTIIQTHVAANTFSLQNQKNHFNTQLLTPTPRLSQMDELTILAVVKRKIHYGGKRGPNLALSKSVCHYRGEFNLGNNNKNKLGLSCAKLMLGLTSQLDMLGMLSPGWIIFNVLNCCLKCVNPIWYVLLVASWVVRSLHTKNQLPRKFLQNQIKQLLLKKFLIRSQVQIVTK